jgi:hypothetical protein
LLPPESLFVKDGFRALLMLLAVVTAGAAAAATNLVPNPGFEIYTSCPPGPMAPIALLPPWSKPSVGTSDSYNTCSGPTPAPPRSGNGFAGLIPYNGTWNNYREYIQAPLTSALLPGHTYRVSFYVRLHPSGTFNNPIAGFGAYFPHGAVSSSSNQTLTYTPQVANPPGNLLGNAASWTLFQKTFVAAGGEDHIIIGNFKNYPATVAAKPNLASYYFVDDVSVELQKYDLSIDKTVIPSQAGQLTSSYSFQLTVRNPGSELDGQNLITVTDAAPAGIAFTGYTAIVASDWNCTLTASLLSCLYVRPGVIVTNQILGVINITASATFLPLPSGAKNCAKLVLTPTPMTADANLANNQSCIALASSKHCPPPKQPGQIPGSCVCPPGSVEKGAGCVTVCTPPKVPAPKFGQCICPPPTVERNGECVSKRRDDDHHWERPKSKP